MTRLKWLGPFDGVDPKDAQMITQRALDLLLGALVDIARHGEEVVGETVHVDEEFFRDFTLLQKGNNGPFPSSSYGTSKMEKGACRMAARHNKGGLGRQHLCHLIDPML